MDGPACTEVCGTHTSIEADRGGLQGVVGGFALTIQLETMSESKRGCEITLWHYRIMIPLALPVPLCPVVLLSAL